MAKMGGGDRVHGKYNIIMSFGHWNKSEAAFFCRARADAPDAYFTLPVGPDRAPPVDDALAHKNQWQKWGGRQGSRQIEYHREFGSLQQI